MYSLYVIQVTVTSLSCVMFCLCACLYAAIMLVFFFSFQFTSSCPVFLSVCLRLVKKLCRTLSSVSLLCVAGRRAGRLGPWRLDNMCECTKFGDHARIRVKAERKTNQNKRKDHNKKSHEKSFYRYTTGSYKVGPVLTWPIQTGSGGPEPDSAWYRVGWFYCNWSAYSEQVQRSSWSADSDSESVYCKSRNFRCLIFGNFGAEMFTENRTHGKFQY